MPASFDCATTAETAAEGDFAGMGEHGRAVALDMLIEPDAGAGLGHKRIAPQFVGFGWKARRDVPAGRVRCNIVISRGYTRASLNLF